MMAINCLTFVLGLLATSGSLVQARRSVGLYGGNDGYRGGERDYTSQAYGSTDRYYRGGDYDYTANSEQYRSQGYDYPANSEQYRNRGYDYPANSEQYTSRGYDYSANFERRNSGYPDWSVAEGSSFPQEDDYESLKSHHHKSPPPSDNPTPPSAPDQSGNPIDDCWRHDPNWFDHRQALASCAIGFGKNAIGGAEGPVYVVTDNSDEDLVNPKAGTLRYAVLQDGPLWIGFDKNMTIQLQNELIMTSHKTIDGRGYDIHISGGAGLTIQFEGHVIVHGLHIHDLKPTGPAVIRSNSSHAGHRQGSDGDAINIFGSHDVWVDHCYFARGSDGLVDAIMGSTFVSVTNNFFEQHDKVMLFGAHPFDTTDDNMQVSVAFNHFAPGLIERVPRLRHGHAHIFNNYYASWGEYAIGGSEGPTILSEGNVFNAPDSRDKQVTKRINEGDPTFDDCMNWNWQSVGDKFLNGAFFVAGGASPGSEIYSKASSTNKVVPAEIVPDITRDAGPLLCPPSGSFC